MTGRDRRLRLAAVWEDAFERGLEIALAGSLIINGRSVFVARMNGEPLAPFLSSALSFLSPKPLIIAVFLILAGCLYLAVLFSSVRSDRHLGRALMSWVAMLTYAAISFAVLTGFEPKQSAERFGWWAVLAFLCAVRLGSRAIAENRKKGDAA